MNGHINTRIALSLVLLPLLLVACSQQEQSAQAERTIAVNTHVVDRTDESVVRTFTGSLEGEKQAVLYAKLSEAVERVHVREGQMVKANQIIVSLDKTGPSARFNEVTALYKNSEKNIAKMENLYKAGAISESQYDAARTEFEVARSNYDAMSRLVDIRTPIAGQVTSLSVREGDFVQVGQQLAVVATPGSLRVKFPVNTDNIVHVRQDAEVRIVSDVVRDTAYGRIVSIAESADPATRSFQVEALLESGSRALRPGMFVQIQVTERKLPDVIAVPRESVLRLDNKDVAFVVKSGVAERRELVLGPELEGRVVIESGLQPGDTLVTLGQSYLDEGFKVTISAIEG